MNLTPIGYINELGETKEGREKLNRLHERLKNRLIIAKDAKDADLIKKTNARIAGTKARIAIGKYNNAAAAANDRSGLRSVDDDVFTHVSDNTYEDELKKEENKPWHQPRFIGMPKDRERDKIKYKREALRDALVEPYPHADHREITRDAANSYKKVLKGIKGYKLTKLDDFKPTNDELRTSFKYKDAFNHKRNAEAQNMSDKVLSDEIAKGITPEEVRAMKSHSNVYWDFHDKDKDGHLLPTSARTIAKRWQEFKKRNPVRARAIQDERDQHGKADRMYYHSKYPELGFDSREKYAAEMQGRRVRKQVRDIEYEKLHQEFAKKGDKHGFIRIPFNKHVEIDKRVDDAGEKATNLRYKHLTTRQNLPDIEDELRGAKRGTRTEDRYFTNRADNREKSHTSLRAIKAQEFKRKMDELKARRKSNIEKSLFGT